MNFGRRLLIYIISNCIPGLLLTQHLLPLIQFPNEELKYKSHGFNSFSSRGAMLGWLTGFVYFM